MDQQQQHRTQHEAGAAIPVRSEVEKYLEALTGSIEAPVTFQTFPEGGPSAIGPRILHGTLDQHLDQLAALNAAGHGIFVMVNEGDGEGRSATNVVGLRALFTDEDGGGPRPATEAAPPTMVVESAHGRHTYWVLQPGEPLSSFTTAQSLLARHFGTDPKVKDLPRVMRVPGFLHQKDHQHPFLVTVKEVQSARYTIEQVLAAFPAPVEAANEPMRPGRRASPARASTVDAGMAVRRARAYLARVPGAVQGQHGDDATYQVACMLVRDFALSAEQALPVFREWNSTCTPPWDDADLVAKLEHAARYATGEEGSKLDLDPEEFEGTQDLCFVVPLGAYFLRLPGGQWDIASPLTKEPARNHLRSLGRPEKVIKNTLAFGLMTLAHGIDCAPGDGATFIREGRVVVNSYRPSRIVPTAGAWPRIKAIVEVVTDHDPAGYAWLFNWMAAKYQNSGARSLTAPVFQGAQGVGKTKLGLILAALLGDENTASISQVDLESQFNGHFVGKLFVIADEVVNQDNIRDTASVLKKYVTDPRVVMNIKNLPQCEVANRMSWWFTSNSVAPVKVEGPGDRRYSVFSSRRPPTAEYKAMLEGLHEADGSFTAEFEREMAAFADALATHPVDRALATRPLLNAARKNLINAGRNSAELFLDEVEERGVEAMVKEYGGSPFLSLPTRWDFGDDGFAIDAVYRAYVRFCEASGMSACKRERLGQEMRMVFPDAERKRASHEGSRVWVYQGLPRHGCSE